jgi:hypothetical protein
MNAVFRAVVASVIACLRSAAGRALAAVISLGLLSCGTAAAENRPLGLVLGEDGAVLRNGRPYAGIGVNYFNCFLRTLQSTGDTSYDHGFKVLAEHHIPFARFCATGFWPSDMRLYFADPKEYFRRFDGVIRAAEKHGVGLVPSLFWYMSTVPDIVGESCDQWGNPASKTHALMRRYVRDVVGRYKDSPAIWAWEFGNEYNLVADLPNAAEHRPRVVPNRGTAKERTARDELTYEAVTVALTAFAQEVRKYDPSRLISSGNSVLRRAAWHNRHDRTWKADTPEQAAEMLRLTTPDPVSLVSMHCYREDMERVPAVALAAAAARKPLFVGEFQVANADNKTSRAELEKFIDGLVQAHVPLAAIWVFDHTDQDQSHNITSGNARAWELGVLRQWNDKLAAGAKN